MIDYRMIFYVNRFISLDLWFLTLLEVPNPTSVIWGFTESLFSEKKKYDFLVKFKT